MRTQFSASALIGASLFAAGPFAAPFVAPQGELTLPAGGVVHYSTVGSKTRLEIRTKSGRSYKLNLERDSDVAANQKSVKLQLVGEVADKALILADTYPSAPLGMSYCQAGEERFLRVLTFAGPRVSETLRVKLASCRDNVEVADPGLQWDAGTGTLQVHWLQGPANKGKSEDRTIHIGADGKPV